MCPTDFQIIKTFQKLIYHLPKIMIFNNNKIGILFCLHTFIIQLSENRAFQHSIIKYTKFTGEMA